MMNLSKIAKNIIKENKFGPDPNNHILAFGQWWTYSDAMRHLDNILFSDDYTEEEIKDFEAAIQKYATTNEPQVVKENESSSEDESIEKGIQILRLLNKVDDDGLDQIASFMGIHSNDKEDQFDKMKEWLDDAPLKEIDKLYLELKGAIGGSEFLEKSSIKEFIKNAIKKQSNINKLDKVIKEVIKEQFDRKEDLNDLNLFEKDEEEYLLNNWGGDDGGYVKIEWVKNVLDDFLKIEDEDLDNDRKLLTSILKKMKDNKIKVIYGL